MRFETTLSQLGNNTGIEISPEQIEELGGGKRPAVNVAVNGFAYASTVGVMGGRFLIPFSADKRAATGIAGGDAHITFASAGTHGFRDSAMDTEMARWLDAEDRDSFRSRPLTPELLRDADLVLTAEHTHRQFILDDHPADFRKVFTLGQFAEIVRSTEVGGGELVTYAGEHRGPPDPALDVPDPYRRGPEAAQACSVQLEELLSVVVPALMRQSRP